MVSVTGLLEDLVQRNPLDGEGLPGGGVATDDPWQQSTAGEMPCGGSPGPRLSPTQTTSSGSISSLVSSQTSRITA